jgi:hypothetical protein
MGHSVCEGGYGRPTESDRLWLLDQEQVPSWHRDVIIQFNRAFDDSRGENGVLDHALQPKPDKYGSYESPELVAAERGIAWRSFMLSHKCSMYDASANSAAAEQNAAFPALGSEYLRAQCHLRSRDAQRAPHSEAGDDADDRLS